MLVIPAMDLLGGRVVRLQRGDYAKVTVYAHDPAAVVASFADAGAAWVHVVDLDGARDGVATQAPVIEALLRRFRDVLQVQVGGGIRTLEQVRAYVDAGASRVVIGTRAVEDPDFVRAASEIVDVTVAVDARDGRVATRGWLETTEIDAVELAIDLVGRGARAVLYTDIARDGTGEGANVAQTAKLAAAVPDALVIASGGIGSLGDIRALAAAEVIGAAVVGRALYERAFSVREAIEAGATA